MRDGVQKIRAAARLLKVAGGRVRALASREPVLGYVGALADGNLGDEACYLAARRMFAGNLLVPMGPHWDERRISNLGLSAERTLDGVVFGGGTLINYHRLPLIKQLTKQGMPLYMLGTGVGPCGSAEPDEVALRNWEEFVSHFRVVAVRGEDSKRRLHEIGFGNVTVTGDLALALTAEKAAESTGKRIGLTVAMPERGVYGEGQYRCFSEIEAAVARAMDRGFEFVPCIIEPKDVKVYQAMRKRLGGRLPEARFNPSVEAVLEQMGTCRAIVSVRLHGAVLGCTLGVPTTLLSYGPKCLEFHRSIGREEFTGSLADFSADWLLSTIEESAATPQKQRRAIWEVAAGYRRRLEEAARQIAQDVRHGAAVGG